jgi:hypothetical protein
MVSYLGMRLNLINVLITVVSLKSIKYNLNVLIMFHNDLKYYYKFYINLYLDIFQVKIIFKSNMKVKFHYKI